MSPVQPFSQPLDPRAWRATLSGRPEAPQALLPQTCSPLPLPVLEARGSAVFQELPCLFPRFIFQVGSVRRVHDFTPKHLSQLPLPAVSAPALKQVRPQHLMLGILQKRPA